MNICVYGAASPTIKKEFVEAGELLGREMAKRGHTLVFGGGASGMMGAVVRGVYEKRGNSIAVVPSFFNVDGVLFENCTEQIFTATMRERKQILEEKADAFIVTVGGIGTYDEFFETLTLLTLGQLGKKTLVILNTDGYYDKLKELMESGVKETIIGEEVLTDYMMFTDSVDEALDFIESK